MKRLFPLLSLLLLFSCNTNAERKRMIKGLSQKAFALDKTRTDKEFIQKIGINSLELKLNEDGTYYLTPSYPSLEGYNGKWDLSHDWEISNYIFYCENGQVQVNSTLSIRTDGYNHRAILYFTEK